MARTRNFENYKCQYQRLREDQKKKKKNTRVSVSVKLENICLTPIAWRRFLQAKNLGHLVKEELNFSTKWKM